MLRLMNLLLSVMLVLLLVSCGADTTTEKQEDSTTAKVEEKQDASTSDKAVEKKDDKPAAKAVEKKVTYVTVPDSTAISVVLIDSIDTDVHLTGAEFRDRLLQPVIIDGNTLFAEGAEAKGVLNKVIESGRLKTPAELNFSLTAIQDKNGQWVEVATDMIMEKKDSHTAREVAMIGGGAIIGGIIGKAIDKKGSTEIGAAAGAAVGTGVSAATGKQDIFHGAGTEITFFTSQPLKIALE